MGLRVELFCSCVCILATVVSLACSERVSAFVCKHCGETIAHSKHLISVPSKLALQRWNKTILGKGSVTTQKFINPAGKEFEVVTLSEANAKSDEDAHMEATWFPGYAWKMSACPRCNFFLGWKYQPENYNHMTCDDEDQFYGFIMNHLAEDIESDSLVMMQSPKSR